MAGRDGDESCCAPMDGRMGCCKVESVISIDDRGQMVLPKEIRDRAEIRAGDKLAVISWEKDGEVVQSDTVEVIIVSVIAPNYHRKTVNDTFLLHYYSPFFQTQVYMQSKNQ